MTMADTIVVMNGGRVEQIGTPLDLYDEPANLFVAGFIGSPAMNFLPGRLVAGASGRGVQIADGCLIPVPGSGGLRDREVILGVRPEHFNIGETCVQVQVIVVEPTGADTQVFCKLAGHNVSAISRERHTFRPGDTISLKPFEGKTYLFDPESGARIA
jgi:multiple sugar transport system ATP-binding protein